MAVGSTHNLFVHGPAPATGRTVGPLATVVCLLLVIGLAVGGTLWWQSRDGGVPAHSRPSVDTRPRPAPSGAPPVLVTSVSGPVSDLPGKDFALPGILRMTDAELGDFNSKVTQDSDAYDDWRERNKAVVTGAGTITVALRGNAAEQVQITDVNVIKKCGPPLDGTHFVYRSQGTGDTVALGFDLDAADPYPQLRAHTTGGLKWTERNYFDEKTLTVKPGELEKLSIGVTTVRHHCSFSLELVVATADGVLTQRIDHAGKPFQLTGPADPGGRPPAGYGAAYEQRVDGWHRVDPRSATGSGPTTGAGSRPGRRGSP
ncbi:hypothetical protein [Streptomyces sp. NPDC046887]|uniref:hypothetical protein n=1 Tax=Streptomyces sp. NPDC046887 TaxID=3155472 RepID=UPI0033E1000A